MAQQEKTRYSDAELAEFKELILKKLEQARHDYEELRSTISRVDGNDTEDTSPTFKVLEEGVEEMPEGRRALPGSVAFVPSVAGMILAGEVIKDLIR